MGRLQHQWDGAIEALRLVSGRLSESEWTADASRWSNALALWNAKGGVGELWAWSGDGKSTEAADPRRQAFTDLCQVLLNSNEFLYLH